MGVKTMILQELTDGKKTRYELRSTLHVSDREIRKAIAELRETNYPNICSSCKDGGYWLGTKAETLRVSKELLAKAEEMKKMAEKMRDYATCIEKDTWCEDCKWRHICEKDTASQ